MKSYVQSRYGAPSDEAYEAWKFLYESVYSCAPADSGSWGRDETQPVLCSRPSMNMSSAAPWGIIEPYYNTEDLENALHALYEWKDQFKGISTYEYDLVVI